MKRATSLVAAGVLVVVMLFGGVSPAAAAPQAPTGQCGAANMRMAGQAMADAMMYHTHENGDEGMRAAVRRTACS